MRRTYGSFLLLAALALGACREEGGGPPMERAAFPSPPAPIPESDGNRPCLQCHTSPDATGMTGFTGNHHFLNNDGTSSATLAGAPGGTGDTARNCLLCHVDHHVFRADLNPASGGRAFNLRVSVSVSASLSPSTFTNEDFLPAHPDGGLCLSCHRFALARAYPAPDGSAAHAAVDPAGFAAATDAHAYAVSSAVYGTASVFRGTCVKCHNVGWVPPLRDPPPGFHAHHSPYARLLAPLGVSFAASDPPTAGNPNALEEDFCWNCHGETDASGAGDDFFRAAVLQARARNLGSLRDPSRPHRHPVSSFRGRHRPSAGNSSPSTPDDLSASNRHVECTDCHDPHRARPGVHATPGNAAPAALGGIWGVEPAFGAGTAPVSFSVVPSVSRESQVCFKCHSSYVSGHGPFDKAAQFSPNGASYHPVLAAGKNASMPASLLSPWASSSLMTCSDCHGNSREGPSDPRGPHASAHASLLRLPYSGVSESPQPAGDLCFRCHDLYTYTRQGSPRTGYSGAWSHFRRGSSDNLHVSVSEHREAGCRACHSVHGEPRAHLVALYDALHPYSALSAYSHPSPGSYQESHCSTRGSGCH